MQTRIQYESFKFLRILDYESNLWNIHTINANIDEVYTTEDIIVCDFRISSQQSIHFRIVILQAIQTKGL